MAFLARAAHTELSSAQSEATTPASASLSIVLTKQTQRGWKETAMHRNLDVFKDALFWGIMAFGVSPIVFGGALLVWLN